VLKNLNSVLNVDSVMELQKYVTGFWKRFLTNCCLIAFMMAKDAWRNSKGRTFLVMQSVVYSSKKYKGKRRTYVYSFYNFHLFNIKCLLLYSSPDILLCQTFGFKNCQFNISSASRSDIVSHFRDTHCAFFSVGNRFNVHHRNFKNVQFDNILRIWSPIIISCGIGDNSPLFLLLGQVDMNSKVAWACAQVWDVKKRGLVTDYNMKFSLANSMWLCGEMNIILGEKDSDFVRIINYYKISEFLYFTHPNSFLVHFSHPRVWRKATWLS